MFLVFPLLRYISIYIQWGTVVYFLGSAFLFVKKDVFMVFSKKRLKSLDVSVEKPHKSCTT